MLDTLLILMEFEANDMDLFIYYATPYVATL
jgi:hypothetical protein